MARVLVVGDDNRTDVEVTTDDDGATTAWCAACGRHVGARPYDSLGDHINEAAIHLDTRHTT